MKELKKIGEMQYNYEQLTEGIGARRKDQFVQLKAMIVSTIRENDVYERDEGIRKILIHQINALKDCKWPLFFLTMAQS